MDFSLRRSAWACSPDASRHEPNSPSLMPRLISDLEDSVISARLLAAGETGLPEHAFPSSCPYTLEQLIDEHFLPQSTTA
ncbi:MULTISPECIES: DUF29 family protein [unclassified Thiocapsa]|uniref:DUF29 family protein n=1 Tax=unclassified Thiocapsa TaxID=2641286 RepID=UPI0035B3EE26